MTFVTLAIQIHQSIGDETLLLAALKAESGEVAEPLIRHSHGSVA